MFGRPKFDKQKMEHKHSSGTSDGKAQAKPEHDAQPKQDLDPCHAVKQQLNELTDQLKRLQAEYENYIKRTKRENEEQKLRANEQLLLSILDVAEDVDRSVVHCPANDPVFKESILMIQKKFKKLFAHEGLEHIPIEGKMFDPYTHEAILSQKTSTVPEGTILEELQRGYTLKGRVIRHTKVKIAKPE